MTTPAMFRPALSSQNQITPLRQRERWIRDSYLAISVSPGAAVFPAIALKSAHGFFCCVLA